MSSKSFRRRFALFILVGLMSAALLGCGEPEYKPAAIQEGVDRCVECNMLIADDEHAAQIVLKDGKVLKFDDIGDLFVYKKKQSLGDTIGAQFVRDRGTLDWIKLESAAFVYDPQFRTPMAYGVLSFKSKADAEKFVQEQGKGRLLTAEELETRAWESAKMNSPMHGNSPMQGNSPSHGNSPMNGHPSPDTKESMHK